MKSNSKLTQQRAKRSIFRPFGIARAAVYVTALFVVQSLCFSAVREIGPIGLTVGDLNRELLFYTNTLPFQLLCITEVRGKEASVLGSKDPQCRTASLKLGEERIVLTEHIGHPGKAIPLDSRSHDHWFQHIAIVVSDMDKAYERLREHKIKYISTAPQTLPEWNKKAGGIKAFYFRDPEDHILEIIWFPPGKGDPKWQVPSPNTPPSTLFLGIDHTALVVSDTEKSLAFYRDLLGLKVSGQSENYGNEQEHLNQVFGARLQITALRAPRGPGIEFLEYIAPPGGRPLPADADPRDLLFWNTHLIVDDIATFKSSPTEHTRYGKALSSEIAPARIIRDPDGHAFELDEQPITAFNSAHKSVAPATANR